MKKKILQIIITLFLIEPSLFALTKIDYSRLWQTHPFYLGAVLGWGCTDWSQLVAQYQIQSEYDSLTISAPISAGDKGIVYGLMTGYEISPHFAMEANYLRFPNSPVVFDQYSLYALERGVITMTSITYAYNVVGKFMVQIAHTGLRGFANAGPALIHRQDLLKKNISHISPTFGIGLNYVLTSRILLEAAFQYYAGYDKATLRPALDYIPFLYTLHFKIGYRF